MSLLLEAMVGFGLLSTCILLIFGVIPSSYATMGVGKDRAIALSLASDKIEELRVAGYTDPRLCPPLVTYGTPVTLGSIFGLCYINGDPKTGLGKTETEFLRSYTVTEVGGAGSSVKRVVVEVKWLVGMAGAPSGYQRSISLETYVTAH